MRTHCKNNKAAATVTIQGCYRPQLPVFQDLLHSFTFELQMELSTKNLLSADITLFLIQQCTILNNLTPNILVVLFMQIARYRSDRNGSVGSSYSVIHIYTYKIGHVTHLHNKWRVWLQVGNVIGWGQRVGSRLAAAAEDAGWPRIRHKDRCCVDTVQAIACRVWLSGLQAIQWRVWFMIRCMRLTSNVFCCWRICSPIDVVRHGMATPVD